MSLPARIVASLAMVVYAAGCDRALTTAPTPVHAEDRVLVDMLEAAGYRGPVVVGERIATDDRGTAPATRAFFLPEPARALLQRTDNQHAVQALRAAILATEVMNPEEMDTQHNAPRAQIGYLVNPSRPTGANPHESKVEYNNLRFLSYDYSTDKWYVVPAGEVLETKVEARDSSGGHWHGTDSIQRHLPKRVGRVTPATGSFTYYWNFTWFVPQFAGDVWITHRLREIGGPNDGDENWFYPFEPDAARISGLVRLPNKPEIYVREGGTPPHPNAFNDFGTPDMIARIDRLAVAYRAAGGTITRVNDISLFFGGRFDVGRTIDRVYHECTNAQPQNCWDYSHQEHRTGTEVDINPERGVSASNRALFVAALRKAFVTVYSEKHHYHARSSASPYN